MGSQLMEQPGVTEISTSTFGEREIVSNLTVIMADPSDAGGYVCMATNAAGQDTAAPELTVHGEKSLFSLSIQTFRTVMNDHHCLLQSYPTSPSLWMMVSHTLSTRHTQ